jgi:hypothetical protein
VKKLLSDFVRVLSLQFVVVLLIISLFVLGYIFRKDALIAYHRWGEQSSQKSMRQHSQPRPDEKYRQYSRKFQEHRKALINLGYLEERDFDTKYLKIFSPRTEAMLAEFRKIYPGYSYGVGGGRGLQITCRPETMPTWESLVKKYDVPPDEPNQPIAPAETPR